jgi:AbrB family looped-hinge helix DNA binding protein
VSTSTVTSKGQVTIPADVRRDLGLKAGSRVTFVLTDSGAYELIPATGSVTALKGLIPAREKPVRLDEMDAAIADAAVARQGR